MPQITPEQKQEFKRLLIRTRKITTDLETIRSVTVFAEFRTTMAGLYDELQRVIQYFPDYIGAFRSIPNNLSHKNPSTFPGTIKMYRSLLDTIEDELNQSETSNLDEFFIKDGHRSPQISS